MSVPTYKSSLYQVKANRILRDIATKALAPFFLTPTEWAILGQLSENKGGMRLSEMAGVLGVEAPLVTIVIEHLLKKELVEKLPHPRDKRAKLLFLTRKGQDLLPHVEVVLDKKLRQVLVGITEEEVAHFFKVLEMIVKNGSKNGKA